MGRKDVAILVYVDYQGREEGYNPRGNQVDLAVDVQYPRTVEASLQCPFSNHPSINMPDILEYVHHDREPQPSEDINEGYNKL